MNEKLSRRRLLGGAAVLVGTAFFGRGTALAEHGQVHGPTIECVEGDRLRIYVTDRRGPNAAQWSHWSSL
jgi:FtsP/CotA-like multicopper oxidase with cupredoxin domain